MYTLESNKCDGVIFVRLIILGRLTVSVTFFMYVRVP